MAHENLQRIEPVQGSSDSAFGLVFAGFFIVIACWPLFYGQAPRWWAFGVAAVLALVAVLAPALLAAPNRLWLKFGLLLGKIVAPIALGILFYCVCAPLGFVMRLTGQDPLRLKVDRSADSYWISRTPPGPPPDSMTKQF